MRKGIHWWKLIGVILGVEAIGMLSGLLSGDISATYRELARPPLAPPGWLFGVVWPVLFALMGVAVYLVMQSGSYGKSNALFWFAVQLGVNFIWSPVFFRLGLYWAAVVIVLVLDVLVAYTMILFGRINRTAKLLLAPYLVWILFATYLTAGVAVLNSTI